MSAVCAFEVEACEPNGSLSVCVYDTLPAAQQEAANLTATGWTGVRVFRVTTVSTRVEIG